jgi:hypothetical protein
MDRGPWFAQIIRQKIFQMARLPEIYKSPEHFTEDLQGSLRAKRQKTEHWMPNARGSILKKILKTVKQFPKKFY